MSVYPDFDMKKHITILFVAITAGICLSASCSTTKGLGQDLQKVGGKIEERAQATGGTAR